VECGAGGLGFGAGGLGFGIGGLGFGIGGHDHRHSRVAGRFAGIGLE
jgi:hypothetical protein